MKFFSLVVLIWLGVVLPVLAEGQANYSKVMESDRLKTIPFKQEHAINGKTLIKVGAVSIFGILMAFAVLIVLKKYQLKLSAGTDAGERICLQAVKRLSPKLMLMIVRVDDMEYLIAQSGDKVSIAQHRELKEFQGVTDE